MFIAQWTDRHDIFPVDEAIRYYNRIKASHPDARIGLYLADIGHPWALLVTQGRPAGIQIADAGVEEWFAHYLSTDPSRRPRSSPAPRSACMRNPRRDPFTADTWAAGPRRVRISDPGRHVTVEATSGRRWCRRRFHQHPARLLADAGHHWNRVPGPGFPGPRRDGYTGRRLDHGGDRHLSLPERR